MNLIRVFVNGGKTIEVSPFSSIYSFKEHIRKKIYKNSKEPISLYYNNKFLENDKTLFHYKITNNSNVETNIKLNGGETDTLFYVKLMYLISIPIFFIFMLSGLPPIVSSVLSFVLDETTIKILNFFNKKPNTVTSKVTRKIVKSVTWIISKFSLMILIWSLSAYMVFPYYFLFQNREYCDAGNSAKNVGMWTMVSYISIYTLYNFFDFIFDLIDLTASEIPIVSNFADFGTSAGKKSWDSIKFIPLYITPYFGNLFLNVHRVIKEAIGIVFDSLNIAGKFECGNDDKKLFDKKLCSFFTVFSKKLNNQKLDEKVSKEIQKRVSNRLSNLNRLEILQELVPVAKEYKLNSLVDSLRIGFCNKVKLEEIKKKNPNFTHEELISHLPKREGTKYDLNTYSGKIRTWFSSFITSIFCQIMEVFRDLNNFIYNVGTATTIANEFIIGQISSLFAIIICMFCAYLNS